MRCLSGLCLLRLCERLSNQAQSLYQSLRIIVIRRFADEPECESTSTRMEDEVKKYVGRDVLHIHDDIAGNRHDGECNRRMDWNLTGA